jgi:hypothetical protein
MHGILQAPDDDAVVPWRVRIGVAAHLRALGRGNQLPIGDVELTAARVLRTGNPVENCRVGGIGDVEDAPAAVGLRAGVHVPAAVHLLDVDLEGQVTFQIGEPNVLDVLRVSALRKRLRLRARLRLHRNRRDC